MQPTFKRWTNSSWPVRIAGIIAAVLLLVSILFSLYWDQEPAPFELSLPETAKSGEWMAQSLIRVSETLLEKRGGYLYNDRLSPAILMDNMPAWEAGVLVQVRDLARAFRKDMSRSQSQSSEDKDLRLAEPHFNTGSSNWLLPSAESEYAKGIAAVRRYQSRLNQASPDARFYARADNLRDWLSEVDKRLGSLSQRLAASVGQSAINTPLLEAGQDDNRTPWLEIDNVFYEARGSCWALLHFLKAAEKDFAAVLADKNATVSLRQIIRELEATQADIGSLMVLNGDGFGLLANHSLVMASYVSRADAALIDLIELLSKG